MPLPDAEQLAVNWVKNNTALDALLSGRCATRVPKSPTMPFLRVYRVAGSPDPGEAPIDLAQLQFDSFAGDGDTSPDYSTASEVARTLIEEATFRAAGSVGTYGTILGMQVINGPRRIEEPDTGYARYLVEILLMSREGT